MAVEHLHLHMRRTHWETKSHENLGAHLQDALDVLDKEGWEVVAVFCPDRTPEIILKRGSGTTAPVSAVHTPILQLQA